MSKTANEKLSAQFLTDTIYAVSVFLCLSKKFYALRDAYREGLPTRLPPRSLSAIFFEEAV